PFVPPPAAPIDGRAPETPPDAPAGPSPAAASSPPGPPPAPVVELRGLRRVFDQKVAVQALDLSVYPGEFFAFLGPNGAGKSTTIKMACAMLRPSAGTARVFGFDAATQPLEVKRRIGVLPEEVQLYERLTPLETLNFAGSLYGLSKTEIAKRAAE